MTFAVLVVLVFPPKRTSRPRTESKDSIAPMRAPGAAVVVRRVQAAPFHAHVSLKFPLAPSPPKITSAPGSVAVAELARATGDFAGIFCVQALPSHSHVSSNQSDASYPPKRTNRCEVGS